jgi:hypothetical protein
MRLWLRLSPIVEGGFVDAICYGKAKTGGQEANIMGMSQVKRPTRKLPASFRTLAVAYPLDHVDLRVPPVVQLERSHPADVHTWERKDGPQGG